MTNTAIATQADLTAVSDAYLAEELVRTQHFHNPVGIAYRNRIVAEIARRSGIADTEESGMSTTLIDPQGDLWTQTNTGTFQGEDGECYTLSYLESKLGRLVDAFYYRVWVSPNEVTHTINKRTGQCLTCGRTHEITN